MLRLTLYILIWVGSMGLAIFSNQNIIPISIKFLSSESIKIPLGLLLIACAGLGAVAIALMIASFTAEPSSSQFGETFGKSFKNSTNTPKYQSNNLQKDFKSTVSPDKQEQKNISKNISKNSSKNTWDNDWSDDWS